MLDQRVPAVLTIAVGQQPIRSHELPPRNLKLGCLEIAPTEDLMEATSTMAKTVFYSFHYDRDVHRVQLVRNINALESQPLLNSQKWEEVRRRGDKAIEEWVNYEINKAWKDKKPLLGVRIHGLASLISGADTAGANPFNRVDIPLFDPTMKDVYGRIDTKATYNRLATHLGSWSSQGMVRS